MISPLRTWGNGERDFLSKPALKYDSTTCSSEDSLLHKPPLKSTSHFLLPQEYLNKGLSAVAEDIYDNIENEGVLLSPAKDQSSEDLFKPRPTRIILSDTTNQKIIDKAFANFSDPYAKFPFPTTPKPPSPKSLLLSPKTYSCVRDRYVTNDKKIALRKAAIQGQQDFILVLKKSGIDPDTHFASLSSKKKSTKRVNFECSTPKAYSAIEPCDTPLGNSSLIDTPLSGFKQLTPDLNVSRNSACSFNFSAPSSPLTSFRSESSLVENSPDNDLPPDIKATLLSGIVCFVDCRTENENRTESVQSELLSLGAKVEKNFTKKVTHVVFKEGRVSTYIKAKKENIPLVGILWIEACKKVRGIADPALHRPKRMQKYDRILPFQMITKRRIAILNPNSRVRRNIMLLSGETPPPSPEKKRRPRKAVTDLKGIMKKNANDKDGKNCSKKLFNNCDINNKKSENKIVNNICTTDSSTDNSALLKLKEAARVRRKSAPGKLLSKKTAKREDIKAYFKKIQTESNIKPGADENNINSVQKEFEKLVTHENEDDKDERPTYGYGGSQLPTQERKKRKLFDPNESFSLSQKSESEVTVSEEPPAPYPATPKRARTKATCGAIRPMKISTRKLHANVKKAEEMDTDSSPSGFWFMNKPDSQSLKQDPPTITFTSIPRSELPNYTEMVKKLGKFNIDEKVTKHTTHLVSNGPRRTFNLIKGIALGCWIIDIKWVIESEACGRWLSHEDYDLSYAFPAAAECCKVRRSLKSTRVMDIFKGSGKIYVSRKMKSSPHFSDVEELLRLSAANVVVSSSEADIIIGKKSKSLAVCVSVKWVLDCVTQNLLLPFHDYIEGETLSQETQES